MAIRKCRELRGQKWLTLEVLGDGVLWPDDERRLGSVWQALGCLDVRQLMVCICARPLEGRGNVGLYDCDRVSRKSAGRPAPHEEDAIGPQPDDEGSGERDGDDGRPEAASGPATSRGFHESRAREGEEKRHAVDAGHGGDLHEARMQVLAVAEKSPGLTDDAIPDELVRDPQGWNPEPCVGAPTQLQQERCAGSEEAEAERRDGSIERRKDRKGERQPNPEVARHRLGSPSGHAPTEGRAEEHAICEAGAYRHSLQGEQERHERHPPEPLPVPRRERERIQRRPEEDGRGARPAGRGRAVAHWSGASDGMDWTTSSNGGVGPGAGRLPLVSMREMATTILS